MNIRNLLLTAFSAFIFFSGCSQKKQDEEKVNFSTGEVFQLLADAMAGNKPANDKLSSLFDYSIPLPDDFNKVSIDSITLTSGKKLYSVLLEHSNPVYSRFAVYDADLRLHLLDKSLNGNIFLSKIDSSKNRFFVLKENFISRDTLKLERASLYLADDSSVTLSLRIYTKLTEPRNEFVQSVEELTPGIVRTTIRSTRPALINNNDDSFTFNSADKKYISPKDIFNNFVITEIKNFRIRTEKPEIYDEVSAKQSVGITPGADTIKNAGNTTASGFTLNLNEDWKELKNVAITDFLKTSQKGTRYINRTIGAVISVISIPGSDSAESYINFPFTQRSEGNYIVRFSDNIEQGKYFVRFVEYACRGKKFLLILEASKYTYTQFEGMYKGILFDFLMDC